MAFTKNEEARTFEYSTNGQTAYIEYYQVGQRKIYLTHTKVPEQLQGQGIGSKLVEHTLSHIKKEELSLIPLCSFVKTYIKRNPGYKKLLDESVDIWCML